MDAEQIERYRALARDNAIDCLITISNQFATSPTIHPIEAVRKSRAKVPVIHWSWMHILTTADLLLSGNDVANTDQRVLLNELRRFLSHESGGVRGFDRMPKEWVDLNRLVSSGGVIPAKSDEAQVVLDAWHQETRDLSLILSRMTETRVEQRLSRKHAADPALRQKDDLSFLREKKQLRVTLAIPDAAAPLDVVVDLSRRSIDVGMTLRAPEYRKTTKARLIWLLKQIKPAETPDVYVRIQWPRTSAPTQHLISDLRERVEIAKEGKEHLAPTFFHLFESKRLGGKFVQQGNFIDDLEKQVPAFYGAYGAHLTGWKKPAPQIKPDRKDPADVSLEALSEGANTFEA
ncbi:MAG: hypothetical protein AAGI13_11220 [Pseudomonadota bacterium]